MLSDAAESPADVPGPLHRYVLDQLERTKYRWPSVAEGSGVPVRTIEKIASRQTRYPRIDTVEKLAHYFREREQKSGHEVQESP